jgi:putative ABC transport system permease protein
MKWMRQLFKRRRMYGELSEEIRAHIDEKVEELVAGGMARRDAEAAARREFGNVTLTEEEGRDVWRWLVVENFLADVRYGLRMLRRSPGFTAVAVITLTLGIGASAAIFSVIYAALLRPLPYAHPDQLITFSEVRSQSASDTPTSAQYWDASYPDYLDWVRQSKTLQSIAGFSGDGFIFHGPGEPEFVLGAQATTNFFSTLGVKPFLGREFMKGEDVASGPKVAILTYGFWESRFGSDPNIIGRSIQLDTNSVSIVGVLPREFEFAPRGGVQLWVPLHLGQDMATRRNLRWMPVVARLAPGVTPAQALTEMNTINEGLTAAYPKENGALQIVMVPLRERIVGQVRWLLLILFGAVGFVLLIACANVANLLIVRALSRRREFAVRAALGAGRGRLIAQLLIESVMLAAAGGALGLVIAQWGTSLLIMAIPRPLLDRTPFFLDAHLNLAVFAFLSAVALLTGLAFGLVPALQITHDGNAGALREEARASAGTTRTRLRAALVVAEIAFSLVLLVGAGLMAKSLSALLHRNPGFDPQNLLTFSIGLPDTSYPKDPDAIRFDREFTRRASDLPGVVGVASNSIVPLTGGGNTIRFVLEEKPVATGQEDECNIREISTNYFSVMKIPLISGRFFDDTADSDTAPKHVIVNRAFAERYFPGENPLGKRLRFTYSDKQPYREVVGVAGDVADAGLDSPPEPSIFLPFTQSTDSFINYIVRMAGGTGEAGSTLAGLRSMLRDLDPQLALIQPQMLEEIVDQSPSVFLRRYPSYLIGSFAALALILAMVGLYGIIAYSVSQRTRELGIRMALGAHPRDVVRLVLGEGSRLALLGVGAGLIAAIGLTRFLSSLLFGVRAMDPVTFIGVAVLLVLVAAAACYLPARRATKVNPVVALRYE